MINVSKITSVDKISVDILIRSDIINPVMREVNEINQAKMDIAGVEGTLDMLSKCDWRTKEEMQVTMARMAKELSLIHI